MARFSALFALPLVIFPACAVFDGNADDNDCTMIGCVRGLSVDFTFKEKGSYVVDVTIDGTKTRCTATLPLPAEPPSPCDRTDVALTLSGSMLPADQQSIGGLYVQNTSARHVTVRVTRDGVEVGSLDSDVTWVTTPGPNGPNCEPKECRAAKLTL